MGSRGGAGRRAQPREHDSRHRPFSDRPTGGHAPTRAYAALHRPISIQDPRRPFHTTPPPPLSPLPLPPRPSQPAGAAGRDGQRRFLKHPARGRFFARPPGFPAPVPFRPGGSGPQRRAGPRPRAARGGPGGWAARRPGRRPLDFRRELCMQRLGFSPGKNGGGRVGADGGPAATARGGPAAPPTEAPHREREAPDPGPPPHRPPITLCGSAPRSRHQRHVADCSHPARRSPAAPPATTRHGAAHWGAWPAPAPPAGPPRPDPPAPARRPPHSRLYREKPAFLCPPHRRSQHPDSLCLAALCRFWVRPDGPPLPPLPTAPRRTPPARCGPQAR